MSAAGARPPARGSGPPPVPFGPLLAGLGLVLAFGLSMILVLGRLDLVTTVGSGPRTPVPTVNPSVVFTPPPSAALGYQMKGTILFAKNGDIWALTSQTVQRLTSGGNESAPTWGVGGSSIYYIETASLGSLAPYNGVTQGSRYDLYYPVIMRMAADGSGPKVIKSGLLTFSGGTHFFDWYLQPDLSPDGKTLAMITNYPDPFDLSTGPTLAFLPSGGGTPSVPSLGQFQPLGHDDPAWSPDGKLVAFTYNQRSGAIGDPRIALYTVSTRRMRFLSAAGYARPSWSPDGKWIAAEKTDGKSRDVVLLSASTGAEVARLTNDGESFAPTWSPDGSAVAFLHEQGTGIDLDLAVLGPGSPFATTQIIALTESSLLDGTSRPAWFIPAAQLPTPVPTVPPASASPSSAPSPSGP